MKSELENKVDLDFIRYANCWEDAEILVEALSGMGAGKKYLSVASAGDNSLMLLTLDPAQVIAADLNPVQLYLTELKMATIRCLDRENTIGFLGFSRCEKRVDFYSFIRPSLRPAAAGYWDQHLNLVKNGIVHDGKFEKYLRFFSKKILPFIHTQKRINELIKTKTAGEQKIFYDKKWNNRRWRFFFRLFFSKYIMGKYGRDPEFLREVKIPVSTCIYQRAQKELSHVKAQNNFMLYYQLKGQFGHFLPPYLWEANFELIKKRLDRIQLFHGSVNEAAMEFGKFDGMNLSNIFEYMDTSAFGQVSNELVQQLNPGGMTCYWNLMVPRRMSAVTNVQNLEEISEKLSEKDKGFFYAGFIVDQKTIEP